MYAKLALRNIRRSLRDYSIYLLTLVFCVAIFYVFNSLGEQPAILALTPEKRRLTQFMFKTLRGLSVIISGVVGVLVLYADNFIIRRRKHELGSYMLLGMDQGKISLMLFIELITIGLFPLSLGLLVGVFAAQFFALVVNRIFKTSIVHMVFVFSPAAIFQTIALYGLCFLIVGLLLSLLVSRYKLIDMLGSSRNEEVIIRRPAFSWLMGLVGTAALLVAYWLAERVSATPPLQPSDKRIWIGLALGVAATYLLFYAAAGLLASRRPKLSGGMARGLNLFIYRQVTGRINTNATQLATIALMLTVTICALSAGLGLAQWVRDTIESATPFDMILATDTPQILPEFSALLDHLGETGRQEASHVRYQSDLQIGDYLRPDQAQWYLARGRFGNRLKQPMDVISYSAFGQLRSMRGYPQLPLGPNEFLIHAMNERTDDDIQLEKDLNNTLAQGFPITLAGRQLQPAAAKVDTTAIASQEMLGNSKVTLVVDDAIAAELAPKAYWMAVNFGHETAEEEEQAINHLISDKTRNGIAIMGIVYRSMRIEMYSSEATVVFTGFYIGIIALVISATLLALQQLADAAEHRQRFEVVRKLGADESLVNRTIARQLAVYFLIPCALAFVHSIVALGALARLVHNEAGISTLWPSYLVTFGIFALIYGSYYALTYRNCQYMLQH